MRSIITIVMIISELTNINNSLQSVISQNLKNWELYLLVKPEDICKMPELSCNNIKVVEENNPSLVSALSLANEKGNGNLIVILNSSDINHYGRLDKQKVFMDDNEDVSICSSLELPLSKRDYVHLDHNKFITRDEIDTAVSGDYIPLDIYTFMIRRSFLNSVYKFLSNYTLSSELDFILFFLRYTFIEKVPEVLYYFKVPRIPYVENLFIDNNENSTNKIVLFNRNKSIEYRHLLYDGINSKSSIKSTNRKIKFKVLAIINYVGVGGTETYILSLAKAMIDFGIYTYILTFGGVFEDIFIHNNIPLIKIPQYYKNAKYNCEIHQYLLGIISSYNINLVQVHLPEDIPLCPNLNVPVILTIHGNFYSKDLIQEYYPYFLEIIFVSNEVKNFYLPSLPKNSLAIYPVIPNSIETYEPNYLRSMQRILKLPENSKIIIYCSRLSYSKGLGALTFLKSFEKVILNRPNVYGVIIGEGPEKLRISSYCDALNSKYNEQKVFILGALYNVSDYFCDCNIIIGSGRVALEGLNSSKTVLALGLKGFYGIVSKDTIESMINNNFGDHSSVNTNLLPGEYSEELTKNLSYLLDNSNICEELARWGQYYCNNNLNINNCAENISKLFDSILYTLM